MGQLMGKFKKWLEKVESSKEKAKVASSQYTRPAEQNSLNSENRDFDLRGGIDNLSVKELFKKIEMLEGLLENQQRFLEEHDKNIQEMKKFVEHKEEKGNQIETGDQERTLQQQLDEYERLLKKHSQSYDKLKKEVEDQVQLQQRLRVNLLAGFLVGFVVMVSICMLPRTLLASG